MNIWGKYFYGNKISDYGIEHKRLDYGTLAKAFDCVLNNSIIGFMPDYWEKESGFVDNESEIDEINERLSDIEDEMNQLIDESKEETEEYKNLEAEQAELEEKKEDLENEMDYEPEVYQWYIVSDQGADILKEINEIVYYNSELDMYLWGVTHWGTLWDYVLTDVPCCTEELE